jgi:hypothetical protein
LRYIFIYEAMYEYTAVSNSLLFFYLYVSFSHECLQQGFSNE